MTVRVEEQFDLGDGVKTDAPGQSGVAVLEVGEAYLVDVDLPGPDWEMVETLSHEIERVLS